MKLCRDVFTRHGKTPGELLGRMTPSQFLAVCTVPPKPPGLDRVAVIQSVNDDRGRRGLLPIVPSWL